MADLKPTQETPAARPRPWPWPIRVLRRLALYYVLVYAGVALIALARGHRYIYVPSRHPEGNWGPFPRGLDIREREFAASDGVRLLSWHGRSPGAKATLLWFHGNAGNISDRLDEMRLLLDLKVDALIVGYRGYGKSEGSPSEEGLYRDAEAAYRVLTETDGIPPSRIILYGQSLGGAVAMDLASKKPCAGLMVDSAFTNVRETAHAALPWFPVGRLIRERYDSISKIGSVRVPIQIQHGEDDDVIPFRLGQRLFAAAPEPKRFFAYPKAGHNDLSLAGGAAYYRRMSDFIALCLSREAAGPRERPIPKPDGTPEK